MSTIEAGGGERLAPCPFCGGTAVPNASEHGAVLPSHRMECDACDFALPWQESQEVAIAAWNTRSLPAAAQALRDAGWGVQEPGLRGLVFIEADGSVRAATTRDI